MGFLNFLFIYFSLSLKTAVSAYYFELNKTTQFPFLAAVLNASDSRLISTAVVISPYWILTVAHLLPPDTFSLNPRDFLVMAGNPVDIHKPAFVITHPTYSYTGHTAEDLALFRLTTEINSKPIGVNFGRFSLEITICDFIYLSQANQTSKSGETSGILLCNNLLTGLLIKKNWTSGIAANFTDVGVFGNWLSSRVDNIKFAPTKTPDKDHSNPNPFLNFYFFLLIYLLILKLI